MSRYNAIKAHFAQEICRRSPQELPIPSLRPLYRAWGFGRIYVCAGRSLGGVDRFSRGQYYKLF